MAGSILPTISALTASARASSSKFPHGQGLTAALSHCHSTPMTAQVPDDAPGVLVAPMKRKGTPQEVADAVLFLSSSKASFMQGSSMSVDGGYVIN